MTRSSALLAVAILIPMAAPSLNAQQILDSLRDRSRVLLVFAPDTLDPRFSQQIDLLNHHAADFQTRDLVLIPIVPDSSLPSAPEPLLQFPAPLVHDIEKIAIRHRFRIQPGQFAVVLLGKDGGEKLRSSSPIAIATLNRTIDAMPMRQTEMRKHP